MEALKQWWDDASSRDQLSVVALGICFLVFALFQFVLTPVVEMKDKQLNRLDAQKQAYARVKGLAAEWKASQSAGKTKNSGSVGKLVEASFAQHGLRVSDFDPSGRSGIGIRFDSVEYDKLLVWFHDIELNQGLRIKDLRIANSSDVGRVTASITIQKN